MTALGHCIQEWYHQQPPTYLLFIFCFYTDTFASKTAAVGDKYADASVGNVTGSNAVNVFLGIGVAWTIAAIYHAIHNQPFKVDPGNLGFSVTVFSVFAVFAISALMVRRKIPSIGGELGGPNNSKLLSSMCFVSLWFLYLILCSLEAYGFIEGFWGCCTKLSSCNSIQVPVFVLHPSATVGCGVFTVHASYAGRCDVPLRLREPDLPAHPEQYLCRKRFEDAISITLALLLARDINLTSRCPSLACFELFGSLQDGVSRWRQPSLEASTCTLWNTATPQLAKKNAHCIVCTIGWCQTHSFSERHLWGRLWNSCNDDYVNLKTRWTRECSVFRRRLLSFLFHVFVCAGYLAL